MLDRIPTPGQEGRVLVTPEDGSTPFYAKIQMADNPTQEGTPLNKVSLLKDATAALYGLGPDAVPDDAFAELSVLSLYHWRRKTEDFVFVRDDLSMTYVLHESNADTKRTIYYGDEVEYVGGGKVAIKNEQSADFSYNTRTTLLSTVKDKFIRNAYESPETIYYVPSDVTTSTDSSIKTYSMKIAPVSATPVYGEEWEYVSSAEPNAYPNGSTDIEHGYVYEYFGRPLDKAVEAPRIVLGSYTGTGKSGSANPNSLTFDFAPKLVIVNNLHAGCNPIIMVRDATKTYINATSNSYATIVLSWTQNTVSWYSTTANGSGSQANENGSVYHYVAFG